MPTPVWQRTLNYLTKILKQLSLQCLNKQLQNTVEKWGVGGESQQRTGDIKKKQMKILN